MTDLLLQTSTYVNPRIAVRNHFNRPPEDSNTWIMMILFVAAVMILGVILHYLLNQLNRQHKPTKRQNPQKLFRDLVRSLRLPNAQRRVLVKMAKELRLRSPSRMLLSPAKFRQTAETWFESSAAEAEKHASALLAIEDALFHDSESSGLTTQT